MLQTRTHFQWKFNPDPRTLASPEICVEWLFTSINQAFKKLYRTSKGSLAVDKPAAGYRMPFEKLKKLNRAQTQYLVLCPLVCTREADFCRVSIWNYQRNSLAVILLMFQIWSGHNVPVSLTNDARKCISSAPAFLKISVFLFLPNNQTITTFANWNIKIYRMLK